MNVDAVQQILIVGLGNPGREYEMTRHNMGALVVQGFAYLLGLSFKEEKNLLCTAAKMKMADILVHIALPTTYMNESGVAVRKYMDYYKLLPSETVIVIDDVDLSFGEFRLKGQGSSGGHNGLKSIQKHLNTSLFSRLRVGIGRQKESRQILSDFVLEKFNKKENDLLPSIISEGAKILNMLPKETLDTVMNVVNTKQKEEKKS